MEHTKEQEKILTDALRAIRETPMKPGVIYTHPIDFEPSEKWIKEFDEVGFDVVEVARFGTWYISTKTPKMGNTEAEEKLLSVYLRSIKNTVIVHGECYGNSIDFEPSEKWKKQFAELGFNFHYDADSKIWRFNNKPMESKFLKSTETTGGYSVRNLAKSGATITGEWEDPEQSRWERISWDADSGKTLKFGGSSSNYDLVAPGEKNTIDKINAYASKDKNYPFGE